MTAGDDARRLLAFDGRIFWNTLRALTARRSDMLLLLVTLVLIVTPIRDTAARLNAPAITRLVLALGLISGIAAGRWIERRLQFQMTDGVLATQALRKRARTIYRATWHALFGAAALIMLFFVIGNGALWAIPSYALGAMLIRFGSAPLGKDKLFSGWKIWCRSLLASKKAGALAATIALLACLLAQAWLRGTSLTIAVATITLISVICLSSIDDRLVRFLTMSGHGTMSVLRGSIAASMLFAPVLSAVSFLVLDRQSAWIVAAISFGGLTLTGLRTLAYGFMGKQPADWLVMFLVLVCALTAASFPVLLPILMIAILWQMQRRAAQHRLICAA